MKEIILQKCNFRCRENIYICRPLRRLRRLAVEYVKNRSVYNVNNIVIHVGKFIHDHRAIRHMHNLWYVAISNFDRLGFYL